MYKDLIKPFFDIKLALILIIILSPLFLLSVVFLFFVNDGAVFFSQHRPGKNEVLFNILKFRTMNNNCDELGKLLPDDQRLSKIGKLIRKTSLDEIPQLINVIKGEMSFVGPRPLLVEYLTLYSQKHRKRHNVRPGITGWAQINGRNAISWTEKFDYDMWYVENQSFGLDFRILISTVMKVLKSENINSANDRTVEIFNGYK
jgi:undecaprenyl phosphate N,N'-diacetylbacillosamine 1-phosphate transferase